MSLLLFVCLARAQEPSVDLAEEADLHFELAAVQYARGDYVGALDHLLVSNRLVPNRNVVFNIARTYERLGRFPEAFRHFSESLEGETDPALRAPAEEAMARIRPKVALVHVTTDPPGATLFVDRRDLGPRGQSPRTLALEPGEHRILVEAPGWEPALSAPVPLVVGSTATVSVSLAQVLGELRVEGTPAGAQVRVDDEAGPVLGVLPAALRLPPGAHLLVVSAEGRRTVRQTVQVEAAQPAHTVVDLPLLTGTVVVNAVERGAVIEVDGVTRGFAPAVLDDVASGTHRLRVSMPGFRPYETEVRVETDRSATVDARLVPLQEVTAASRVTQAVEDAPASVTIVGAEELRVFGSQTLTDALAGTRGVYATSDRTYEALGFRGFSRLGDYGNRVLVTLDGHTLNDDQLGASYVAHDLLPDLMDIERIEVVRGPGSALYGTGAFFGVLNLVTRTGETARPRHVSVAADGTRTARARAGATGKIGETGGWWLSAGGVVSQGEDFVFDEYEALGLDGRSEGADAMEAGGARGRAWVGDFSFAAYWNLRDKEIPTGAFDTVLGDPRARTLDARGFAELRWEPTLNPKLRLYTRAFVDRYDFRGAYPYEDDLVKDLWHGTWTGAEVRAVATPAAWLRVTAGGEVDLHLQADLLGEDSAGAYLDEHPTYQLYAGYAVVDLEPARAVSASIGARADIYSTFGLALSPRATLVLRPGDAHTVKLLAGRAFRAPSPYELFYNDDGDTQIVAVDLGPETVVTGELEYTWRLGEVTSATAAVYYDAIDGLIELVQAEGGLQYVNSEQPVRTLGGELELRRSWRRGWMLAYTQSVQRTRAGDLLGDAELTNSPQVLSAIKAAAPVVTGVATAATRLRYESPRLTTGGAYTEPAVLWDVFLTGLVPAIGLEWGVGVRNALDWQYGHPGGEDLLQDSVPQPGRTGYLEATLAF